MKFYICKHCGNVITKLTSAQVPVKCCGEEMHVLEAGVTDAAQEKHVPAVTVEGSLVKVAELCQQASLTCTRSETAVPLFFSSE